MDDESPWSCIAGWVSCGTRNLTSTVIGCRWWRLNTGGALACYRRQRCQIGDRRSGIIYCDCETCGGTVPRVVGGRACYGGGAQREGRTRSVDRS